MAKCTHCNSCLKYITVFERKYLYCSLCRRVFIVQGDRIKEITDTAIVMEARRVFGNAI